MYFFKLGGALIRSTSISSIALLHTVFMKVASITTCTLCAIIVSGIWVFWGGFGGGGKDNTSLEVEA